MTSGVLSGGLAVVAFAVIHDLWIADIWFNIGPMVLSGALCGWSIVLSYQKTTTIHSWGRWAGYNGACALLLIGLGAASFLVLDPRFTMAEMMNADDALSRLLPPAMPLIIGGTIIGALLLWVAFGRRRDAIIPILITQALLMFLVGHNLAILGLVEIPAAQSYRVLEFVGVTVFLAAGFAVGVALLETVSSRFRPGLPTRS
jgi:hypothetical protein